MCESNPFLRWSWVRRLLAPALILFLLAALHANASVGLVRFEIVPQAGEFLSVQWETASETNTALFRVYRAQEELPLTSANWGVAIHEEPAKADLAGAAYVYPDYDVASAVRYWYMLEEVTSTGGSQRLRVAAGGINLPTLTPTSTKVPGVTPSTSTPTQTPDGNQPAATATQRYTNTPSPLTPVVATPTVIGAVQPTATPLPPAVVATPTGGAAAATLFVPAASPTSAPRVDTPAPPPSPTATVAVIAAQPSPEVTKTPLVFQATSVAGTPAPSEAAAAGPRNTQRLLLFGGGAIALAAVLAAIGVFAMRARRQ